MATATPSPQAGRTGCTRPAPPEAVTDVLLDRMSDPWQVLAGERPFLLRLARLQLGSQADAEDAAQGALVGAARGWPGYAGRATLRSWLTGILRHKIVDLIRSRRPGPDLPAPAGARDGEAECDGLFTQEAPGNRTPSSTRCGATLATLAAQRQLPDIVELCMRRVPEDTARLFLMREYLGMELEVIQAHCMLTNANLRVVLYRARMRMRECRMRSSGEPE